MRLDSAKPFSAFARYAAAAFRGFRATPVKGYLDHKKQRPRGTSPIDAGSVAPLLGGGVEEG